MNIYLIRHGQSVGNTKKGFVSGRTDKDGLTVLGRSQVVKLAWELSGLKFGAVYTSPVQRAKETAEMLAQLLDLDEPTTWNDFEELNYGIFEGKYWWEVIDQIPEDLRGKSREDFTMKIPQGESFRDLAVRVWAGFEKLISKNAHKQVIIVTHDAVIGSILYGLKTRGKFDDSKAYFDFVHKAVLPNASAVKIRFNHQGDFQIREIVPSGAVQPRQSSVDFYLMGTLGWSKNIKFKLAKTLSKNLVYEISDLNHKALFKLLSDKETLPSKRLISLYQYLEQNTKIPVPKIFYFDDSRIFFNKDVVVQDYVKGGVQTNCIRKHPSDLSNLFMQIERAVSEIHRINPTEVKDFWYPNDWNQPRKVVWQKYLIEEIGLTLLWLPNFDLEIEQKLAAAKKLNALVKRIKEEEIVPVPLHGDLSPPNIIIDHAAGECKLVRIVDFERARMGDAVWDLVYYYGFLERLNENVANQWKKIVWEKLDPDAKSRFDEYRFLFHAWTVRDMIDMPEEISRTKAGKKSLAILRTDCLQIA